MLAIIRVNRIGLHGIGKRRRVAASSVDRVGLHFFSSSTSSGNTTAETAAVLRPVEELYERKDPIDHVLSRPQMYVGSIETVKEEMFVSRKHGSIELQDTEYVPALVKLFDEILVNAADNAERDTGLKRILIELDEKKKRFAVENDGIGIPVEVHKKENLYVPELVFGHLLTGSNFDDSGDRYTGGRHGYGAKLTNIMSNSFEVETLDTTRGKHFRMQWQDHMKPLGPPQVNAVSPDSFRAEFNREWEDYTRVSFSPDLSLFGLKSIDSGSLSIMRRRALDIAGILAERGVEVYLNGKQLKIKSFVDYGKLFFSSGERRRMKAASFSSNGTQIFVTTSNEEFLPFSFVNCIATKNGGTHLDLVVEQVAKAAAVKAKTKPGMKGKKVTASLVKKHLAVFVSTRVPNPTFDSQTKDRLTSSLRTNHQLRNLPPEFTASVLSDTNLMELLSTSMEEKERKALIKSVKPTANRKVLLNIPKLEDAVRAGTKDSSKCTLILTEGDSAKSLAVAGLSVVGRDCYGVFPLRGKLLNVREASNAQLIKNAEIANLISIIGLDFKKKYKTDKEFQALRYGRVMIMTDQDYDGSHIKGLIINLFHHFWPELLKRKGFLAEFVTPLLKVQNSRGDKRSFFTIPEYETWASSEGQSRGPWTTKYYKGLGTSTSKEAREYFNKLHEHTLTFVWADAPDTIPDQAVTPEQDEAASTKSKRGRRRKLKATFNMDSNDPEEWIDMAFSGKRAEDRRLWLARSLELGDQVGFVDHSCDFLSYRDFIAKELVLFSQHDTSRSIPSVVDGLKPSQRKVLFAALKRNLEKEIKVVQLAGFCSEQTAYHHGEASLYATIINMAHDFIGSNNLPILVPSGQFGTRLQGGKDAASPRYIFTSLQPFTRALFPKLDDALLTYNVDDGQQVEPVYFVPILPLILINGGEGIGTGWSTHIPAHNPLHVIDNLLLKLDGKQMEPMIPWYCGFRGKIEAVTKKRYSDGFVTEGVMQIDPAHPDQIVVSELPVGTWTEDFKARLHALVEEGTILSVDEYHTEYEVLFKLTMPGDAEAILPDLKKKLRFSRKLVTSNMHLFDSQNCIRKYEDPREILEEFFRVRLDLYRRRRDYLLDQMQRNLLKLRNQVRFTQAVCSGEFVFAGKPKASIMAELEAAAYAKSSDFIADESHHVPAGKVYDYLLETPLWGLTQERMESLEKKLTDLQKDFDTLQASSAEKLWEQDLIDLRTQVESYLVERMQRGKGGK